MSDKSIERLLYLVSPIGLLALWQLLLMAGFGDRRFIPAPSDIAVRFAQMIASGELALHTAVTLWRIAAGYIIGAIPGVAIGLLMAMFRPVRLFFDPLIAALFPIPKVALMPLLLLAFGFGDASKIALVAIAVFFPVIVNTYEQGRQYRQDLLGRGEKLWGQPDRDVHPHRILRRAAHDLRGASHRARGLVHRRWRPSSSPPRPASAI